MSNLTKLRRFKITKVKWSDWKNLNLFNNSELREFENVTDELLYNYKNIQKILKDLEGRVLYDKHFTLYKKLEESNDMLLKTYKRFNTMTSAIRGDKNPFEEKKDD